MTETLIEILRWAFPTGIGTVIGWLINRHQQRAESARQIHQAYKEMYEDVSQELVKLRKEYNELSSKFETESTSLRRAVNRLSRAMEAVKSCVYHDGCPVLAELRDEETGGEPVHGSRGHQSPSDRRRSDNPDKRDRKSTMRHSHPEAPAIPDSKSS